MTQATKRTIGALTIAATALVLAGVSGARASAPAAEEKQPSIFDFIKPGGDAGRIIEGVFAGLKLIEAVGLETDPQAERAYGEAIALGALSQYPLSNNEALNKYVTMVGLAIVAASDNPSHEFQFGLLESDVPNAFATPHGVILISTGSLKLMRDESELAGVLAHEIAHVFGKHGVESVKNAKISKALVDGAMVAAGTQAQAQFGVLADAGREVVLEKGYDRDTEYKADAMAVALTRSAGYDPAGLRRFLERLNEAGGDHGAGSPFSTHPGHKDRIKRLKGLDGNGSGGGSTMAFRWISTVP
ncbi:MAG: M48 family metalloprotease [Phycisphaerales bacterium]